MGSNSCIIRGTRRPTICDVARAELAADVYNDSGAPDGWHRVGQAFENEDSGFYAQLYAPDGFIENLDAGCPGHLCPPTLAFRGTNFEDKRLEITDSKIFPGNAEGTDEWLVVRIPYPILGYVPVGLKFEGGDWVTNVLQAMGKKDAQYEDARVAARQVEEAYPRHWEHLTFTGHSLGGGLAGCVGVIHEKEAVTFNSAGVHRYSVSGRNPATASKCINFWVTDEIVTTLQENPSRLPLSDQFFFVSKRLIDTPYTSLDDLPDAAGGKLNLHLPPLEEPEFTLTDAMLTMSPAATGARVGSAMMRNVGRSMADFADQLVGAVNQFETAAVAAMQQNALTGMGGNPYQAGAAAANDYMDNRSLAVASDRESLLAALSPYASAVADFYNEAVRRHLMSTVLPLIRQG